MNMFICFVKDALIIAQDLVKDLLQLESEELDSLKAEKDSLQKDRRPAEGHGREQSRR